MSHFRSVAIRFAGAAVACGVLSAAPSAQALTAEEQLRFADGIYLRGLYSSALSEYVAFARDFPKDPSMAAALYRIGECYRQMGNRAGADRFYARVTGEYPESAFAARAGLRRAEIAIADGRFADAAAVAQALVKGHDAGTASLATGDDLASALYSLAFAQAKQGHGTAAADAYKRILAEAPSSPHAAYAALELASLQAAGGKARPEQIREWFRLAADTAASPSAKAEALYRHGNWCYGRQEWREASDVLQQLMVEFPASPRAAAAQLAAGWAAMHLDEPAEALVAADGALEAVRDAASHAAALYLRANALRALNRTGEAIADYSAVVAQHADAPSAPFAAYELMATHFQAGDYEKALANLPPSPTDEQRPDILWMRAECENALGRTDLARGRYSEVAEAYPQSPHAPDALMRLAEMARAEGRSDEAADLFRRTAQDYPSSSAAPAALKASALARMAAGEPLEALADYDAILAMRNPAPPAAVLAEARLQRALCLLRADRSADAAKAFDELLADAAMPADIRPQALYWSATLAARRDKPKDAEQGFRACLSAGPDADIEGLARLGLVLALQAQDRLDEAADQAALLLDSADAVVAHPSLIEWLVRHRLDQDRVRDAATAARALATYSAEPSWRQIGCHHLGQAFEAMGRAEDAAVAYASAIQQDAKTREGAESCLRLAALELAAGNAASASRRFAEAAEAASTDDALDLRVRAYFGLAEAAEAQKDLAGAARHYMSVAVLFDDPEWTPLALSNAVRLYGAIGLDAQRAAAEDDLRTRYPSSSFARQLPAEVAP